MKRKLILSALAGIALVAAPAALAQGRGGGNGGGHGGGHGAGGIGGGVGGGIGGGMRGDIGGRDFGVQTRIDARAEAIERERAADRARERANENSLFGTRSTRRNATRADQPRARNTTGVETRTRARANSQGAANANPRALERANANSALRTTTVTPLTGLSAGMSVVGSNGMPLGTVTRVNRAADGTIRNVLVRTTDGARRTISLAPGSLTLNGDVLVTTQLNDSRRR
ncbi:MAG: hypothetical protein ACK4SZ_07375 [Allosphingosinicella sp.]|uniref:hypothetical protein n=1 Tax=Allosphingosinicella sp. TaxID=2823234 RepID=UPI003935B40F